MARDHFEEDFLRVTMIPSGPAKRPSDGAKSAAGDFIDLGGGTHRGRRHLTPSQQTKVGRKISTIAREQPGLTQKQRVGKAVGIVRHREMKKR